MSLCMKQMFQKSTPSCSILAIEGIRIANCLTRMQQQERGDLNNDLVCLKAKGYKASSGARKSSTTMRNLQEKASGQEATSYCTTLHIHTCDLRLLATRFAFADLRCNFCCYMTALCHWLSFQLVDCLHLLKTCVVTFVWTVSL